MDGAAAHGRRGSKPIPIPSSSTSTAKVDRRPHCSRAANRLANTMIDFGVARGDRIATLTENSSEAVISLFGANRAGAIGVPINTAYKGEYLRHQLGDSGAKLLIVDAALAERARAVVDTIDALDHVIVVGESETDTGHHLAHVGRRHDRRRPAPRGRGHSHRSQRLHLHRRYHRPVEGLHGQPQLHRDADQADRHDVGPRPRRRRVVAVAVVPLQRGHRHARRHAPHRRAGRDLPEVLGVELLARDQPRGRDPRQHARQHGHAPGQRPDAPRGPRLRLARANQTLRFISGVPMPPAVRARCIERWNIRPFDGGYGTDRGLAVLVAAAGDRRTSPTRPGSSTTTTSTSGSSTTTTTSSLPTRAARSSGARRRPT